MTIYQKTPGALIATGQRTVATFESGLVRVDQVYICATSDAEGHRATVAVGASMPDGNTAPCVDGLYIFPAPQEVKRGDGFTEFRVSAYGRTTTTVQSAGYVQVGLTTTEFSCSVFELQGSLVVTNSELAEISAVDRLDCNEFFGISEWVNGNASYAPFDFSFKNPSGVLYSFSIGGSAAGFGYYFYLAAYDVGNMTCILYNPILIIKSIRRFGKFLEVEIVTSRKLYQYDAT